VHFGDIATIFPGVPASPGDKKRGCAFPEK